MRRSVLQAWLLLLLGFAAGCGTGHGGALPVGSTPTQSISSSGYDRKLCNDHTPNHLNCMSRVLTAAGITRLQSRGALDSLRHPDCCGGSTRGFYPVDLQAAYKTTAFIASGGIGKTVAIVDAYDDPNAESDLAVYRARFGLSACTTANGCFKKVAQDGSTSYPVAPSSDAAKVTDWEFEVSLDVDMVSANCPNCKILLVEADDNSGQNLQAAETRAASFAPFVISNSWGGAEFSGEASADSAFAFNGIAVTASAGDDGTGPAYPAVYPNVIAVGGTTLTPSSSAVRGWSETTWADSGSGCSAYIPKPVWQHDIGCATRTENDLAYNADTNSPVLVYDTEQNPGSTNNWYYGGGTSEGAPAIAAILALTNTAATNGAFAWASYASLFDVTTGANDTDKDTANYPYSCAFAYICNAGVGYDGPTGNGTPNGAPGPAVGVATPSPSPTGPFLYVVGGHTVSAWPQQNFSIAAVTTFTIHPNQTDENIAIATAADGSLDIVQNFQEPITPSYSDCRVWVGSSLGVKANQYECNPGAPAYGTSGVTGQRGYGAVRGPSGELDVIELVLGTYESYDAVARISASTGVISGIIPLSGAPKSHQGIAEPTIDGHIYVASTNAGAAQIVNYPPGVVMSGGVVPTPKRTFTLNGRVQIGALAISPDAVTLYGATKDSSGNTYVDSFASAGSGAESPLTSIAFGTTPVTALTVDANGTLYVAANGNVYAYLPTATGNATPLRTLTYPLDGPIAGLAIGS